MGEVIWVPTIFFVDVHPFAQGMLSGQTVGFKTVAVCGLIAASSDIEDEVFC